MKRSEMLNILQPVVSLFRGNKDISDRDIALIILQYVENSGMLPPYYIISVGHEYIGTMKLNDWEPEDEY